MRVETSVVVKRPIDEVWAFLTDTFNVPRFGGKAVLGFRQTSPGPIGVGTTYEGRVVLFGLERRASGVITEWDPPHTVVYSLRAGILRDGFLRLTLETTSDGTRVVRVGEYNVRGIWRLLFAIARPFFGRWLRAENQNLKRLLEADRG
ncbi:MAG: SRPBCC family protein [Thermoplasmata archaeon]